jgi:hypothetical protein
VTPALFSSPHEIGPMVAVTVACGILIGAISAVPSDLLGKSATAS